MTDTPWSNQTLYTRILLSAYDWMALGLHCRFIWQCSADHILKLYNQHISSNHLDIGVGTGYFLDKCRFPMERPRLALMDINTNSLAMAQKRLKHYSPQIYRCNILKPLHLEIPRFDSIGMTHLLHCLPGNLEAKEIVFQNILLLLNSDGVLFGSTFVYQGIKLNPLARQAFWWTNRLKFMSNKQDSPEALERILNKYFSRSHIELCGCDALFWAVK